jgi:GT2 family glycosyltransferase
MTSASHPLELHDPRASARPRVCALVLNWCAEDLTSACVETLERSAYPALEVLVIDNASPDGSGERLARRFPHHRFLQTGENLGYTGGNNRGIEMVLPLRYDYLLILNNDTEISPDAVERLVEAAESGERVGAVAPKILYHAEPDRVWFGGGHLSLARALGYHRHEGVRDGDDGATGVEEVSFLTGCCLLVPVPVLREVGSFAEDYFAYVEDVEFCHRLRSAGYRLLYQPEARILHHSPTGDHQPTPGQIVLRDRNRRRLARSHLTPLERLRFALFFYPSRLIRLAGYVARGDRARAMAIVRGALAR